VTCRAPPGPARRAVGRYLGPEQDTATAFEGAEFGAHPADVGLRGR
jgi:hypothetical protein